MLTKAFVLDFVVALILFGFCASDKGSYVVIPGEITGCMSAVNKDPTITTILKNYDQDGRTLLNGSIAFKKDLNDIRFCISYFRIDLEKKKKIYDIRNLKCDNIFTNMMINTILGTRYLDKTCNVKAGVYNFTNFDMDMVYHQLPVFVLPFGKYNMQLKYKLAEVQLGCLNFPSSIEPLIDS